MKKIFALAGNPNAGKTSVFNELTGSSQYVGNWPGVTVEKKEGVLKKNKEIALQDLPGIYSLSPYTPEEIVARRYLLEEEFSGIINVVDATNLERNLYLTTQLLEIGQPLVVAVNMMDLLRKSGQVLNLEKLAYGLNVPVVGVSALKKKGLDELVKKSLSHAASSINQMPPSYDPRLEAALSELADILGNSLPKTATRFYLMKVFERDEAILSQLILNPLQKKEIAEVIHLTEKIFKDDAESIVVNERYAFIERVLDLCTEKKASAEFSVSDKIDAIVTNRFLALPIFALVMWAVYYLSIQTIGTLATDWVNEVLFGQWVPTTIGNFLQMIHVAPWMQSLVLDGIVGSVGAVLGFLPQLLVLFFCLAILEDCGYMSRIAFVMDRLFRKFGLSGKSFIPMLIATGCGVPAVMASRTIENEADRKLTVMVTTFMPCSAKLPIIALISGAFFPHNSWVAPSSYFLGISAIVLSGIALKKTALFAGDPAPFIMELPNYHWPQPRNVIFHTLERGKSFVKKAGTIIFVSGVFIWLLSNFNWHLQFVSENESLLADFGRFLAPIFAPLGWGTWQGTVATLMGLVAKENVLGTFGVLLGGLSQVSDTGSEVWPQLQTMFTPMAAYSFLAFNLLCAPCFAAMGAIAKEMNNRKWTALAISYQCGLAYVVSLIFYQVGHVAFEGGQIGFGFYMALVFVGVLTYFVVRKPKKSVATVSLSGQLERSR
ncbi:ferrous iron transport protein B [Enterococcus timonensis]|uniref:ferrous iron transport protein B n=1 Tax=Enterococcus timonensis TaxID=1852364 RepID=UPI0008DA8097|nr:ferrous iron transport protein B [Enterococcus timonensis]